MKLTIQDLQSHGMPQNVVAQLEGLTKLNVSAVTRQSGLKVGVWSLRATSTSGRKMVAMAISCAELTHAHLGAPIPPVLAEMASWVQRPNAELKSSIDQRTRVLIETGSKDDWLRFTLLATAEMIDRHSARTLCAKWLYQIFAAAVHVGVSETALTKILLKNNS